MKICSCKLGCFHMFGKSGGPHQCSDPEGTCEYLVRGNEMFKSEEVTGQGFWLAPDSKTSDGSDRRNYLHSNGDVLTTPEYWPARADAETILAKYPDAAPPVAELPLRKWVHGDVFANSITTNILIYFAPVGSEPLAFCIDACCGPAEDLAGHLKDAKFLFNINDVVKERQDVVKERQDVVKERRSPSDAESLVEKLAAMPTPTVREPAGLVSVAEMQEFVDYAEPLRFCNSGTHVCDTLLDRFEKVLAQIKEDEQ